MKQNKHPEPMPETTKDDSSDVQQVQHGKQGPPPENPQRETPAPREDEEAEKGHS